MDRMAKQKKCFCANVDLLDGDAGHFCLLLSPVPMLSRSVAEARVNTESDPHPESPEVVASSVAVSSDMPHNIFEEVPNIFVVLEAVCSILGQV